MEWMTQDQDNLQVVALYSSTVGFFPGLSGRAGAVLVACIGTVTLALITG
jgi:hypothetical protein